MRLLTALTVLTLSCGLAAAEAKGSVKISRFQKSAEAKLRRAGVKGFKISAGGIVNGDNSMHFSGIAVQVRRDGDVMKAFKALGARVVSMGGGGPVNGLVRNHSVSVGTKAQLKDGGDLGFDGSFE